MVRKLREVPREQESLFCDYLPPEMEEEAAEEKTSSFVKNFALERGTEYTISVHPRTRYGSTHKKHGEKALYECVHFLQKRPLRNYYDAAIVIEESGYLFGYYERNKDGSWTFISQRNEPECAKTTSTT